MRLIDADKLHYSRIRIAHSDGTIGGYNAVVMSAEIKDAPTVDAVPVVRCKDCKHRPMLEDPAGRRYGFNVIAPEDEHGWEDNTCPYLVDDGFYSGYPNDDDFCSCGERKTE